MCDRLNLFLRELPASFRNSPKTVHYLGIVQKCSLYSTPSKLVLLNVHVALAITYLDIKQIQCLCTFPGTSHPQSQNTVALFPNDIFAERGMFLRCPMFVQLPYSLAPTNLAQASVLNDFGRSMGAPTARSMMSWGSTPIARDTPNRTV